MSSAREINVALCELVGLDPNRVRHMVITMKPESYPTIEATLLVFDEPDAPTNVLARYALVPIDQTQPTTEVVPCP